MLGADWGLIQRSYVASANLWSDSSIQDESSVGTTQSNGPGPSVGQQLLLTELLATRNFRLAVARDSPMAPSVKRMSPVEADYAAGAMAAKVTTGTAGPQVLSVSVKDKNPAMATGIAGAVARQFLSARTDRLRSRATEQLQNDQQQLLVAAKAVSDAQTALAKYSQDHAGATPTDKGVEQLATALAGAQQQYGKADEAVTKDNAALSQIADKSVIGEAPGRVFLGLVLLLPLMLATAWLLFVTVERRSVQVQSVEDGWPRALLFPRVPRRSTGGDGAPSRLLVADRRPSGRLPMSPVRRCR